LSRLDRAAIRRLVAFVAVGGASALIDAGVFLLLEWLGLWPTAATAVSFSAAFIVNYRGNRDIVFRAGAVPGALRRYVVLVIVNLGLSMATVGALTALGVVPWLAKGISMVLIAGINYVAMRAWVFRDRGRGAAGGSAVGGGVPPVEGGA
jgi:putative flippase GtrA